MHFAALFFGKYDVLAVMICYELALLLLVITGLMVGLGMAYYLGLIVAEGIALYHYQLIKDRNREACFKAFLHNN